MKMQIVAGNLGITNINRRFIIFVFAFLLFSPGVHTEVWGDDKDDVKKQMQELRQQMEQMQKKLEELEEKNKKLEEETKKQKEEKELEKAITEAAPPPPPGGGLRGLIQSLNPDISVIGTFAAAYFTTDNPISHAENDPQNTGINLQEIEVGFQAVVDPYFRLDSFFSFLRNDVEVEELYATTLSLPLNTQIRAGIMRSKFGRINLQHREVQDFVTLPLPVTSFLAEHLNPTGVEFNFLLPLSWFSELSASVNSSNGLETPTFAPSPDANNLGLLLYIAHLSNFFELSDDLSLSLGGSFATGSNGTSSTNRSNLYGADLFLKYNPLKYSSSYQQVWLQSEFMYRQAETPEPEGNFNDWGAYVQAIYRFAKRWNTGARFDFVNTNNNSFVPPPGEEGLFPTRKELNYAAMLTFNPSEFSRIRLQYEFDDPSFRNSYSAVFLQFEYSIGAHGAHPF